MATITEQQALRMWRAVYQSNDSKDVIKTNGALPLTTDLAAIFQIFEDVWTTAAVQSKTDIETIVGRAVTNGFVKRMGKTWLRFKVDNL